MTPGDRSLHPSRRHRMLALFDLLSPEDEAQLQAHLADCAICREWMSEARAQLESQEFTEHVPASVLARWRRLEPTMGPRERALYERHLRSCGTCSEALGVVLATHPSKSPVDHFAWTQRPAARRPWFAWPAWGWAFAGVAAALILVVVLAPRLAHRGTSQPPLIAQPDTAGTTSPPSPVPAPSVTPPTGTAQAPTPKPAPSEAAPVVIALAPIGATAVFELRAQQRDVETEPLEIALAGVKDPLRLRLPPTPLFDPMQSIEVRIVGPDDRVLATLRTTPQDLGARPVVRARPSHPWVAGDYRVELVSLTPPEPGLEPESVSYPFRIR